MLNCEVFKVKHVSKIRFGPLVAYLLVHVYSAARDLLWIDVYGFRAFCEWFLRTYPTYFVSPLGQPLKVCSASINLVPEESWMPLIMQHPRLPILLNSVLLSIIVGEKLQR